MRRRSRYPFGEDPPAPPRADVLRGIGELADKVGDRYRLTHREKQVLGLSAAGMLSKEVASELGCSKKTVDEYWRRIYRKMRRPCRREVLAALLFEALTFTLS